MHGEAAALNTAHLLNSLQATFARSLSMRASSQYFSIRSKPTIMRFEQVALVSWLRWYATVSFYRDFVTFSPNTFHPDDIRAFIPTMDVVLPFLEPDFTPCHDSCGIAMARLLCELMMHGQLFQLSLQSKLH